MSGGEGGGPAGPWVEQTADGVEEAGGGRIEKPAVVPAEQGARVQIDRRLLEFLVCPVTRGPLVYDPERMELVSKAAKLAFPIHNGIPVMLLDEARRLD